MHNSSFSLFESKHQVHAGFHFNKYNWSISDEMIVIVPLKAVVSPSRTIELHKVIQTIGQYRIMCLDSFRATSRFYAILSKEFNERINVGLPFRVIGYRLSNLTSYRYP